MYSLLHRKSALSIKNKILLYKVGIRPILTYGCPVFSSAAKTHLKKIQTTQNKILKMILNVGALEPPSSKCSFHSRIFNEANNKIQRKIKLKQRF
jgi:hypothetical protein